MLTVQSKVDHNSLIEQRNSRDKYIKHIDVLEKVKRILLIPKMESMTTNMVAEYFGVAVDVIQRCYQRNKEEIESDGVKVKTIEDFRGELNVQGIKSNKRGGGVEFQLDDNIIVSIPYGFGVKTFSKRAILRIAMLLRDSEVAKKIRSQLLDVFEKQEELITMEVKKFVCGSVWYWNKEEGNPSSDRPVIVISNENRNEGFANVSVLPITRTKRNWSTETPIVVQEGVQSYVQGDQIHTVQIRNIGNYYGNVSEEIVLDIKKKLIQKLGLTKENINELNSLIKVKQRYKI